MKKILSILLAMIMLQAIAAPAMAATITVPETDKHTYAVYQIFTGDLSNGILSNVKWGKNGIGEEGEAVADDVLTALEAVTNSTSNIEKLAVITEYVNLNTAAYGTVSSADELKDVPAGYYLIKDNADVEENDAYTTYIVKIVSDVVITRKSDVPTVDKKIIEGTNEVVVGDYEIGDEVSYKLTGTLPENYADYKWYKYVFHDTLSEGLTFNKDSVVVKVDGNKIENGYTLVTEGLTDGCTFEVQFEDLKKVEGVTITAASKITVEYTATLNENAKIDGANPNTVHLQFSNNPNYTTDKDEDGKPDGDVPMGETPDKVVEVYTTEVHIEKVDEDGNALTGAEFQITGESLKTVIIKTEEFTEDAEGDYYALKDGTYTKTAPTVETEDKYEDTTKTYKATEKTETKVVSEGVEAKAYVGEDGKLTFTGLGAGTYTITETTTPAGYNTVADIKLTIAFDETDKIFTYEWEGGATGNTNTIEVVNMAGSLLPSTGGIGTTIFYIAGAILVVGAVVVMISKKRSSEK